MYDPFRHGTIVSYVVLLAALAIVVAMPLPEPIGDGSVLLPYVFAFLPIGAFSIFWWSGLDYPYPKRVHNALALALYSAPLFVLNTVYGLNFRPPVEIQAVLYVVMFLYMTTLTLGDLPLYGGAYREGVAISNRRGRAERTGRICSACLTATVPEDSRCWRCGSRLPESERSRGEEPDVKSI